MKWWRVILGGAVGTITMSLFSNWWSVKKGKEYREPVLLEALCNAEGSKPAVAGALGWGLHAGVGLVLAAIYHKVWPAKSATLMQGTVAGVYTIPLAIASWHTAFKLHPNPPETDYKGYYQQLAVAHIIFGATVGLLHKR